MMNEFLDTVELDGKTATTVKTYYFRLKKYQDFLQESGFDELKITPSEMAKFKYWLLKQGCGHRYINALLSVVRCYYDFLIVQEARKEANPVLSSLRSKAVYPRPAVLSDSDLCAFESWVATLQPNLQVGFKLMLHAGLRVSEASSLIKSDISLRDGVVYLKVRDAKWNSDREVPVMNSSSARFVWNFVQGLDLGSKPICRVSDRTLQKYSEIFRDSTGVEMSCHTLRHTFATRLAEAEVPMEKIRQLMGHKNLNMTAHYTQSARISFDRIAPTIWQS